MMRAALGGALVFAVLAIAYVFFWFVAASILRGAIEDWAADGRAHGYAVAYRRFTLGGFPWRLRAVIEAPRLAAPGTPPPWAWQGERATAWLRPWNHDAVTVEFGGKHRVALVLDAEVVTYEGAARLLRAEIALRGGRVRRLDLDVGGLVLSGNGGTAGLESAEITVRRLAGAAADHRAVTVALGLKAKGITVPRRFALPLGNQVRGLRTEIRLMGAIDWGAIDGPPSERPLAAWRDAGGTIEIPTLGLIYGPLSLEASGTIALDAEMQPIGAMSAKIKGFFETLDRLRERGLVRPRDAVMAKIVLGVLSRRPADGGAPILTVPLTVQGRRLYVGPVDLAELPALVWPGTK